MNNVTEGFDDVEFQDGPAIQLDKHISDKFGIILFDNAIKNDSANYNNS